jgi:hypothetical protein
MQLTTSHQQSTKKSPQKTIKKHALFSNPPQKSRTKPA